MGASAKANVGVLYGDMTATNPIADVTDTKAEIVDLGSATRNQIQIMELGFTVTGGSVSTNTSTTATTATVGFWYQKPGSAPVLLATYAHATSVTVGSEITTRDGSLAFVAAYQNASNRVFAKGTRVFAGWDDTGNDGTGNALDSLACYSVIDDFGARPA
tara:strand:+ start:114 stop:593 length:480 start_codon:yes stop_codon:yes gene_type:complete